MSDTEGRVRDKINPPCLCRQLGGNARQYGGRSNETYQRPKADDIIIIERYSSEAERSPVKREDVGANPSTVPSYFKIRASMATIRAHNAMTFDMSALILAFFASSEDDLNDSLRALTCSLRTAMLSALAMSD